MFGEDTPMIEIPTDYYDDLLRKATVYDIERRKKLNSLYSVSDYERAMYMLPKYDEEVGRNEE